MNSSGVGPSVALIAPARSARRPFLQGRMSCSTKPSELTLVGSITRFISLSRFLFLVLRDRVLHSVEHERHLVRIIRGHRDWMRRAPEGAPIVGERTKHVCRRPKVVENDHRSRNQQHIEVGQSEKGRGIKIAVAMNDEAGSGREPVHKAGQGVLKPAPDEADPLVVELRDRAPHVECTLGVVSEPVLRQSFERIKANETALRITVHLRPESDAVSRVDAEFEEIDCGPAAYLDMNIAIEIVQVCEGGYPSTLLRNPASNQGIVIDHVKQANVPRK